MSVYDIVKFIELVIYLAPLSLAILLCEQVSAMALAITRNTLRSFTLALIFASAFCIISGKAEQEEVPEIEIPVHDPAQVVAKALLCFNDKYIYSSCEESYRLSASGNLDVPPEQTEGYCGGACLTETQLVLNCIDNILANFVFYNRATIQDVRDTIHAGCGYGPERGNFNVAEHIEAEGSNARRVSKEIVLVIVLGSMIIGHGLLFM